jgi:formylglycine-generating enzyme required for sulfatase activity
MYAMPFQISIRTLSRCLIVLFQILILTTTGEAASAEKRIVVLDLRIENDIGVQNAGPIATDWLVDSVYSAAPDAQIIPGRQAARLARLTLPSKIEDISPAMAMTLRKSIDTTHILGGEVFLWEKKYGVVLRLIELPGIDRVRIERAWATRVEEIPEKIEELATRLLGPARTQAPAEKPPAATAPEKNAPKRVPSNVRALLEKHPEMVYVPAGEFIMGNDNDSDADNIPLDPSRREGLSRLVLLAAEKPEHTVRLDAFLIDKYEVTNREFSMFRSSHAFPAEKADHPVTGISWYDARAYAEWAGKRLPTEAEWEKAARGDDGRKWPWGNIFERNRCNLGTGTAPVGAFSGDRSPYGAFDMAGNVQEWTASRFVAYPGNSSDSVAFDEKRFVVRGSYYGGNDFLARCSMRFCALPGESGKKPEGLNYEYIGFRCAMDID